MLNERDYVKHTDMGYLCLILVLYIGLMTWTITKTNDRLCVLEKKAEIYSGYCK